MEPERTHCGRALAGLALASFQKMQSLTSPSLHCTSRSHKTLPNRVLIFSLHATAKQNKARASRRGRAGSWSGGRPERVRNRRRGQERHGQQGGPRWGSPLPSPPHRSRSPHHAGPGPGPPAAARCRCAPPGSCTQRAGAINAPQYMLDDALCNLHARPAHRPPLPTSTQPSSIPGRRALARSHYYSEWPALLKLKIGRAHV